MVSDEAEGRTFGLFMKEGFPTPPSTPLIPLLHLTTLLPLLLLLLVFRSHPRPLRPSPSISNHRLKPTSDLLLRQLGEMLAPDPADDVCWIVLVFGQPEFALFCHHVEDLHVVC